jgi:hypothetical protein
VALFCIPALYARARARIRRYTKTRHHPPLSNPATVPPKIPPHSASTPQPRIYPPSPPPTPAPAGENPPQRAMPNLTPTPHTTYRADVPLFWLGGEVVGDLSLSLVRVPRGWSCPQAPRAPGRPAAALERAPDAPQAVGIIRREWSDDICHRTNAGA